MYSGIPIFQTLHKDFLNFPTTLTKSQNWNAHTRTIGINKYPPHWKATPISPSPVTPREGGFHLGQTSPYCQCNNWHRSFSGTARYLRVQEYPGSRSHFCTAKNYITNKKLTICGKPAVLYHFMINARLAYVGTSAEGDVLTVGIEGSVDFCVHVRGNGWFPGTSVSLGNYGHHIQFNSIITWTVCRTRCFVLPSLWTCRDRGTSKSYTNSSALRASNVACNQVHCQKIYSNGGIIERTAFPHESATPGLPGHYDST